MNYYFKFKIRYIFWRPQLPKRNASQYFSVHGRTYCNPPSAFRVGQISEGQYLRLKSDGGTQTLVYEITEDGFYHISITTIGKLNKNFTVESDVRYDVRWRLLAPL